MKKILLSFLTIATFQLYAQKIYTYAGTPSTSMMGGYSGDGGLADTAKLQGPQYIKHDNIGNLYIADAMNNVIRKVTPAGIISTYAGNGTYGYSGDGGAAINAAFMDIKGVAADKSGNVYISTSNGMSSIIRMVDNNGIVSTYVGGGYFVSPQGLACDSNGVLYVADNNVIYKVSSPSNITAYAGINIGGYTGDGGLATAAEINNSSDICFDNAQNMYICDMGNACIRKIDHSTGIITTVAGIGQQNGYSGDGGQATSAKLNAPYGVGVDSLGNIYIADTYNYHIRKVNVSTGVITTYAGTGSSGYNGDAITATTAQLNTPYGISTKGADIYVADRYAEVVRIITTKCIPPTIKSGPMNDTVCKGSEAIFYTNFVNSSGVQWQVNKGSGFVNLNNSPVTSLINGNTMDTILNVSSAMNGYQYQCIVKGCSNVTTSAAILTVRYPVLSVNTPTICPGTSGSTFTVTSSTANSYSWNTGDTGNVFMPIPTPTATSSYTVTGTDNFGCQNTIVASINVQTPPTPQICMVTTDSSTNYQNNIILWDNTQYLTADSFIIYRFDALGSGYVKIGTVSKDSSRFIDTARYIGSLSGGVNGDPNYGSYKYTLALKDTCGNISSKSPYHLTEFLQDQQNGNFNVSEYKIEAGQTNPVTGYALYRDNNNTQNYTAIAIINSGATSATDPSYSSYPNANYRIDILGFSCVDNQRLAYNSIDAVRIKSHSNSTNNRATNGIKKVSGADYQLSVYPNPANSMIKVSINSNQAEQVKLYDILGNEVLKNEDLKLKAGFAQIDISNLESGVYFVKVGNATKKFVKQ